MNHENALTFRKRYSMRSKTRQHKVSSTALSDLWPHGMLVNTWIKTVHMCI